MAKNIKCPRCKGTGTEEVEQYDREGNMIGWDNEKCSYCNGSGEVDYDEDYYNKRANKHNSFW